MAEQRREPLMLSESSLPASRGYAGHYRHQRRSSSRCALRALHVDPVARTGNGTLMARAPRSVSLTGAFCLVELTRLELVTPCLQSRCSSS